MERRRGVELELSHIFVVAGADVLMLVCKEKRVGGLLGHSEWEALLYHQITEKNSRLEGGKVSRFTTRKRQILRIFRKKSKLSSRGGIKVTTI